MKKYNPSDVGVKNGKIFGLPFNFNDSEIIILPIAWEATASFGDGTSKAPEKILSQSIQLDLFHQENPNAWQRGVYMLKKNEEIYHLNQNIKPKAKKIIEFLENGNSPKEWQNEIDEVNIASNTLNQIVFQQSNKIIKKDKKLILLGGDHSCSYGAIKAISEQHHSFGILQIDAHADLRDTYEGFIHSHASIMFNVLKMNSIEKLVQVGIRDICQEEADFIKGDERIHTFYDKDMHRAIYSGKVFYEVLKPIVDLLPQKVYLSIDIDGLDPKLCPNTGTPVPGGLDYNQLIEIIRQVKLSGREIIACDLVEVGNSDWDANVAARILYELVCYL